MPRSKFLEYVKRFDDNYLLDEFFREYAQKEALKNNQTIKEYLSSVDTHLELYSQLDYRGINLIMTHKDNAFSPFYDLETDKIDLLLHGLHTVNLFLRYFNEYKFDRLRKYEQRESLINKYDAVLEDLAALKGVSEEVYKILRDRKQSLSYTPTITERRIFEHLLHTVCLVMDSPKNTKRIAAITNRLIRDYFNTDSISFSEKTSIDNFKEYHYSIESQGSIILHHSTPRE